MYSYNANGIPSSHCVSVYLPPPYRICSSQKVFLDLDLHAFDSWYIHKIRNLLGIKHSYYSHVSHRTVFQRGGSPLLFTFILEQQIQFFLRILTSPKDDSVSHFPHIFCIGLKRHRSLKQEMGRPRIQLSKFYSTMLRAQTWRRATPTYKLPGASRSCS